MTTGRIALLSLLFALLAACGSDEPADTTTTTLPGTAPPTTTPGATEPAPDSTEPAPGTTEPAPGTLTILSHDSFADGVTDETFATFTAETGTEVELVAGGDAGGAVNQAILTRDNPIADVLFGVDDTFLSRALGEDIFVPYESERLEVVDPRLILDEQHRVTPIDYGD
ncbi:MAG: thiamine ABC transporter substrate-binding protein, partial [Actinomycetota bacterium]